MKKLKNLMLSSNFICSIFYSLSYPYIYAKTMEIVSRGYISFEQIAYCLSAIIFCFAWNKYGNKLWKIYPVIIISETVFSFAMFLIFFINENYKVYFINNVLIYSLITKNMACGGTKMRALVNKKSEEREKYDNTNQALGSVATVVASLVSIFFRFKVETLFIFALIGNIFDNFFYFYIYFKLRKEENLND